MGLIEVEREEFSDLVLLAVLLGRWKSLLQDFNFGILDFGVHPVGVDLDF